MQKTACWSISRPLFILRFFWYELLVIDSFSISFFSKVKFCICSIQIVYLVILNHLGAVKSQTCAAAACFKRHTQTKSIMRVTSFNYKNNHNLFIVYTLKHDEKSTILTIVIKYTIKINKNVELGYRSLHYFNLKKIQ
jgi:hypothetical protein